MPDHECRHCEAKAERRCSGCKDPTAWYCSANCQRKSWPLHVFDCNPAKPIKTVYYIARAAITDNFPDHPQAEEDYGFTKAFSASNRSKLLGLYQGLFNVLDVEPQDVHKWRVNGTLTQEIKKAFETLPENNRGGYYPWFLQNQWVLDPSQSAPTDFAREMMLQGWRYSIEDTSSNASEDHIRAALKVRPADKQRCYNLSLLALCSSRPRYEQDIWIFFGFCTCKDDYEESRLGVMYAEMVKRCTFSELLAAYRTSSLAALMGRSGLRDDRDPLVHLQDVLSQTQDGMRLKSVWWLKQYVLADPDTNLKAHPAVIVDYGFINCRKPEDQEGLNEIYKKFFECRAGDPIELHSAAIAGKLFEHVSGVVKVKKRFQRLMKNPYPLPGPREIAN